MSKHNEAAAARVLDLVSEVGLAMQRASERQWSLSPREADRREAAREADGLDHQTKYFITADRVVAALVFAEAVALTTPPDILASVVEESTGLRAELAQYIAGETSRQWAEDRDERGAA